MIFLNNKPFNEFDILVKNLFDLTTDFCTVSSADLRYPIDISSNKSNLKIDIAMVGAEQDDIDISVEGDVLNIKYDSKVKELTTDLIAEEYAEKKNNKSSSPISNDDYQIIRKGITKRSFNFAWRIAKKYELSKLTATLDKGLLTIIIPAIENVTEKIKINVK